MPIWLRKFTFQKIKTFYDEERESIKKASGKGSTTKNVTTDGKVTSPEFLKTSKSPQTSKPSYTTRMSKKS